MLAWSSYFHVFLHLLPQRSLQYYVHHHFLLLEHTYYWQEGVSSIRSLMVRCAAIIKPSRHRLILISRFLISQSLIIHTYPFSLATTLWCGHLRNLWWQHGFMDIYNKIIQGGITDGSSRAFALIKGKCLVDERMILCGQMGESPGTSCVFGKDRALMQIGQDTAGIQHKRDEVLQRMFLRLLNVVDDRSTKIEFWHQGKALGKRFPSQTDATLVENHEVGCQIRIILDTIIPVIPTAIAQILLIRLAQRFTIVQITGQGVLERK